MNGSLYFHIPFCDRKCPYCHFFVLANQEKLKDQYSKALREEWELVKPLISPFEIASIYFGGGTPTCLPPSFFDSLLKTIAQDCRLSAHCEITLEANPEHVTVSSMQGYKAAGINRISMGVQSLNDPELMYLKRNHSAEEAKQAICAVHEAGISNISIDLMYEIPKQTIESFSKTLDQIQKLPITHLSLYNLTIEPHTPFERQRQVLKRLIPTEEEGKAMLDLAVSRLESYGLKRYEISAFAKDNLYSRHNVGYWTARPFLGLGPSAFSYFEQKRFRNICHLPKYCQMLDEGKRPIDFEERLSYPANLCELLAVQFRLIEGVDLDVFQKRHGRLTESILKRLEKLTGENWLNREDALYALTNQGLLFYDTIASELIE